MDDTQDHVSEKGVEATSLNLIPPETVLVVVRSGILKHTLPVAVTTQPMVINQDIKALILKPALIPDYLGLYLSILGHKLLPTISKHSTTVQSINTEQFNSLLIPVPSLDIQHRLVSEMQAARPTRQQKLAQAETLLAGLDGYLLERLGLTLPTENKQKAFAIRMRQIQGKRIDALAYRPYYDAKNQLPETPTRPLGEIAYIDWNQISKPESEDTIVPYVGLPECDLTEVREVAMRPYREVKGRSVVKPGDILFARIEPSAFNQKYVLVDDLKGYDYAYTSTEFYVVQAKEDEIYQDFLYAMFFCSFVFNQVKGKTTGSSGRRRITPGLFATLQVPVPDKFTQQVIATEVNRRRNEARQLRAQAEQGWTAAKSRFELALSGEVV